MQEMALISDPALASLVFKNAAGPYFMVRTPTELWLFAGTGPTREMFQGDLQVMRADGCSLMGTTRAARKNGTSALLVSYFPSSECVVVVPPAPAEKLTANVLIEDRPGHFQNVRLQFQTTGRTKPIEDINF